MPMALSVLNRVFTMSMTTSCSNTRRNLLQNDTSWSYQWTREANHSISSTKWSFNSEWCRLALTCVFDSVSAYHTTHDNPLAYRFGAFDVVFTSA